MRQDQYEKLQELTEKLTDAFITEADPAVWPGNGVAVAAMDQQTRGDRYWCKKNAAATLTVLMKTTNLIGVIQMRGAGGGAGGVTEPVPDQEDSSLDVEMKAAEKEATRLLNQLTAKAHGK